MNPKLIGGMLFALVLQFYAVQPGAAQDFQAPTGKQSEQFSTSRHAKVQRSMMPDDPNFDPNWDWTENRKCTLYIFGTSPLENIELPYYSNRGPASIFHSDDTLGTRDIHPRDGWVLVFRDFGTLGGKSLFLLSCFTISIKDC